ncbi:hypothetical protein ABC270_13510 [Curtobacterium sp. 1P10AnD]|uniref:hypothetical protein n=1 Tax=Curtobacterium sp. 1P10AnD TaxID=3132283 RepID=UPI0039A2FAF9
MGDMTAQAAVRPRVRTYDLVVRPRSALVRSTALSIAFSAVPLAVALVWVSFPFRLWALMAAIVVLLAVVVGAAVVRLGTAYVGVDATTVDVRGVLSASRRIPRDAVDRILLVETYGASVDRSVRELVAFAADGSHLFRLRGDVWGDAGLDRVVDELGVTVTEEPKPLSSREFARRWPSSRAWYERSRAFIVVGLLAALVVGGLLVVETAGLLTA